MISIELTLNAQDGRKQPSDRDLAVYSDIVRSWCWEHRLLGSIRTHTINGLKFIWVDFDDENDAVNFKLTFDNELIASQLKMMGISY